MPDLRPYQSEAIDRLRANVGAGHKRNVLVAPTGAGKTVMGTSIIESAVAKGSHALFIAHRRELVHQASRTFSAFGISHGILMAGEKPRLDRQLQVASVDTLIRRLDDGVIEPPRGDLVMIDEAHRSISDKYAGLVRDRYPESALIGLTATPVRGDGTGLGVLYDGLVESESLANLIRDGYLVQPRYYAPSTPDLKGVQTQDGDYVQTQLAEAVDQPDLVGDVVENWARLAKGRRTIVFATSVAHSRHLADAFHETGVRVAHVDGKTPDDERDQIMADLSAGNIDVLCNCLVATEGLDVPEVSCIVLARPTKSLGLYIQMGGRGLRPAPDKADCLILDHSGAVHQHGFLEDPQPWSLDSSETVQERRERTKDPSEPQPITCDNCDTVFQGQKDCPVCGWQPAAKREGVEVADGDLGEVDQTSRKAKDREWTQADKQRWYSMLLHYAQRKGYKPGWAARKFKEKVKEWPPKDLSDTPIPPDDQVARYIKSRQIAFAKGKAKGANQ